MRAAWAAEVAAEFARRLRLGPAAAAAAGQAARRGLPRKKGAPEVHVVGSLRRGEARAGDVDLLAVVPSLGGAAAEWLAPRRRGDAILAVRRRAGGARRRAFTLQVRRPGGPPPGKGGKGVRRVRLDLFLALPGERPFALFHFTGPRSYNVRTRAQAARRGLRLNQYGLFRPSGRRAGGALRTEAALARFLGLRARPPGDRR